MSTGKKVRRSDEEWRQILADLDAFEGTVGAFAEQRGINASLLAKVRRRLEKRRGKAAKKKSSYPIEKILELHAQGVRQADISRRLNVPIANVHYYVKRNGSQPDQVAPAPTQSRSADVKTAIALLRQMDKEVMRLIRSNKIQAPDRAHMLGMMALRELTGDQ